jgi:hypothetical protein
VTDTLWFTVVFGVAMAILLVVPPLSAWLASRRGKR